MTKKPVQQLEELETFYPSGRKEWRTWLKKHHLSKESIWLVLYKKETGKPSIPWSDAVDEALCFGWIDGRRKTLDEERFIQHISKRKPKSGWSKINKEKIERLTSQGLMMEAGFAAIETAKKNGSWTLLDEIEEMIIPADLEKVFRSKPGSKKKFLSLSKSVQKFHLHQLMMAKRPETQEKRINDILMLEPKSKQ